jgi:hypothetical protein
MSLRPFPRSSPDPRPSRRAAPVLSVGRRAFINGPGDPRREVVLTDDAGRSSSKQLADGVEVEIVAWRPRGAAGTRYHVQLSRGGATGWLDASELRAAPAPDPPAPPEPEREAPGAHRGDPGRKFGQRR